jgi:predicted GNAT superfamily acetyltransferase
MIDFRFRPAIQTDFSAILALNRESEHFLSPLNAAKLNRLANEAAMFQVALSGATVAGFLLVFGPQADYDSPNFISFKARYDDFLYVDRIVISEAFRGHHLATSFYEQLDMHALARGVSRVVCEVDIDPPNPASLRFHEKLGFIEVGQHSVPAGDEGDHQKIVSLQVKALR